MNSVTEKEKKLNLALAKLKNLNLKNPDVKKNIENLSSQKNQLEIEKQEIEEKYKNHDQFNDYLKDDIESAKNDLKYFYHFKRIGYHLIHILILFL